MNRAEAIAALESEGLFVTEWKDDPHASYTEHTHAQREVRIVLEGTMTIVVDGVPHELLAGDRLDLAPDAPHSAQVGPQGVHYLAGTDR